MSNLLKLLPSDLWHSLDSVHFQIFHFTLHLHVTTAQTIPSTSGDGSSKRKMNVRTKRCWRTFRKLQIRGYKYSNSHTPVQILSWVFVNRWSNLICLSVSERKKWQQKVWSVFRIENSRLALYFILSRDVPILKSFSAGRPKIFACCSSGCSVVAAVAELSWPIVGCKNGRRKQRIAPPNFSVS